MKHERDRRHDSETAGCACAAGPIFYLIPDRGPADQSDPSWNEEIATWRRDFALLLRWSRLCLRSAFARNSGSPKRDTISFRKPRTSTVVR
jgi:hypothetical protein